MKKLYNILWLSMIHTAFGDTTMNNNSIHTTTIYMTQSPRITMPVKEQPLATIPNQQDVSLLTKSALTVAGIAITSYAALVATLCYQAYRIRTHQGWGQWKQQVPLAVLQEIPEKELAIELHKALKATYGDLALPILCSKFLEDSAQEIKQYTFFLELRTWINTTPLQAIMPAQATTHQEAIDAVMRLEFLQGIIRTDYFQEKSI